MKRPAPLTVAELADLTGAPARQIQALLYLVSVVHDAK